jgi:tripartite-type tricarboxylate transporter receptor subunit TctC
MIWENAMKLPRRQFLHLAAGTAALSAVSRIARAQAYPTRPGRIVVGYAAGGITDVLARLVGQWLSERLGQQFIVENRPGAASNIATEAVLKGPSDGYTLLMVNVSNAMNAALYANLKFGLVKDAAPIIGLIRVPGVVVVHPSVPATTVSEFVSYSKANSNKISFASGGVGTPQHIYGELFKMMAGVELVHVPYRGGAPATTDLIGGQVHIIFGPLPESIEHIKAGRLRALAVTTEKRLEALPGVATVGEFLPGYEASGWQGVAAPRNTPTSIVEKLNSEINAGLADAKISERLVALGGVLLGGSSADFGRLMSEETEKWAKVIKFAGIKPE